MNEQETQQWPTRATNKWADLVKGLYPEMPQPVIKHIAEQQDATSAAAVARAHMKLAELADIKPDKYFLQQRDTFGRTRG